MVTENKSGVDVQAQKRVTDLNIGSDTLTQGLVTSFMFQESTKEPKKGRVVPVVSVPMGQNGEHIQQVALQYDAISLQRQKHKDMMASFDTGRGDTSRIASSLTAEMDDNSPLKDTVDKEIVKALAEVKFKNSVETAQEVGIPIDDNVNNSYKKHIGRLSKRLDGSGLLAQTYYATVGAIEKQDWENDRDLQYRHKQISRSGYVEDAVATADGFKEVMTTINDMHQKYPYIADSQRYLESTPSRVVSFRGEVADVIDNPNNENNQILAVNVTSLNYGGNVSANKLQPVSQIDQKLGFVMVDYAERPENERRALTTQYDGNQTTKEKNNPLYDADALGKYDIYASFIEINSTQQYTNDSHNENARINRSKIAKDIVQGLNRPYTESSYPAVVMTAMQQTKRQLASREGGRSYDVDGGTRLTDKGQVIIDSEVLNIAEGHDDAVAQMVKNNELVNETQLDRQSQIELKNTSKMGHHGKNANTAINSKVLLARLRAGNEQLDGEIKQQFAGGNFYTYATKVMNEEMPQFGKQEFTAIEERKTNLANAVTKTAKNKELTKNGQEPEPLTESEQYMSQLLEWTMDDHIAQNKLRQLEAVAMLYEIEHEINYHATQQADEDDLSIKLLDDDSFKDYWGMDKSQFIETYGNKDLQSVLKADMDSPNTILGVASATKHDLIKGVTNDEGVQLVDPTLMNVVSDVIVAKSIGLGKHMHLSELIADNSPNKNDPMQGGLFEHASLSMAQSGLHQAVIKGSDSHSQSRKATLMRVSTNEYGEITSHIQENIGLDSNNHRASIPLAQSKNVNMQLGQAKAWGQSHQPNALVELFEANLSNLGSNANTAIVYKSSTKETLQQDKIKAQEYVKSINEKFGGHANDKEATVNVQNMQAPLNEQDKLIRSTRMLVEQAVDVMADMRFDDGNSMSGTQLKGNIRTASPNTFRPTSLLGQSAQDAQRLGGNNDFYYTHVINQSSPRHYPTPLNQTGMAGVSTFTDVKDMNDKTFAQLKQLTQAEDKLIGSVTTFDSQGYPTSAPNLATPATNQDGTPMMSKDGKPMTVGDQLIDIKQQKKALLYDTVAKNINAQIGVSLAEHEIKQSTGLLGQEIGRLAQAQAESGQTSAYVNTNQFMSGKVGTLQRAFYNKTPTKEVGISTSVNRSYNTQTWQAPSLMVGTTFGASFDKTGIKTSVKDTAGSPHIGNTSNSLELVRTVQFESSDPTGKDAPHAQAIDNIKQTLIHSYEQDKGRVADRTNNAETNHTARFKRVVQQNEKEIGLPISTSSARHISSKFEKKNEELATGSLIGEVATHAIEHEKQLRRFIGGTNALDTNRDKLLINASGGRYADYTSFHHGMSAQFPSEKQPQPHNPMRASHEMMLDSSLGMVSLANGFERAYKETGHTMTVMADKTNGRTISRTKYVNTKDGTAIDTKPVSQNPLPNGTDGDPNVPKNFKFFASIVDNPRIHQKMTAKANEVAQSGFVAQHEAQHDLLTAGRYGTMMVNGSLQTGMIDESGGLNTSDGKLANVSRHSFGRQMSGVVRYDISELDNPQPVGIEYHISRHDKSKQHAVAPQVGWATPAVHKATAGNLGVSFIGGKPQDLKEVNNIVLGEGVASITSLLGAFNGDFGTVKERKNLIGLSSADDNSLNKAIATMFRNGVDFRNQNVIVAYDTHADRNGRILTADEQKSQTISKVARMLQDDTENPLVLSQEQLDDLQANIIAIQPSNHNNKPNYDFDDLLTDTVKGKTSEFLSEKQQNPQTSNDVYHAKMLEATTEYKALVNYDIFTQLKNKKEYHKEKDKALGKEHHDSIPTPPSIYKDETFNKAVRDEHMTARTSHYADTPSEFVRDKVRDVLVSKGLIDGNKIPSPLATQEQEQEKEVVVPKEKTYDNYVSSNAEHIGRVHALFEERGQSKEQSDKLKETYQKTGELLFKKLRKGEERHPITQSPVVSLFNSGVDFLDKQSPIVNELFRHTYEASHQLVDEHKKTEGVQRANKEHVKIQEIGAQIGMVHLANQRVTARKEPTANETVVDNAFDVTRAYNFATTLHSASDRLVGRIIKNIERKNQPNDNDAKLLAVLQMATASKDVRPPPHPNHDLGIESADALIGIGMNLKNQIERAKQPSEALKQFYVEHTAVAKNWSEVNLEQQKAMEQEKRNQLNHDNNSDLKL